MKNFAKSKGKRITAVLLCAVMCIMSLPLSAFAFTAEEGKTVNAYYDTGVSADYGDKLITLSTCEYSGQNSRLVVVAKKVTESGGSNAPSNDGATEIQS